MCFHSLTSVVRFLMGISVSHVRDKEKKHLSSRYVPAWSAAVSSCEIYLFFA